MLVFRERRGSLLDRLRSPSRPGNRACARALCNHPKGRRTHKSDYWIRLETTPQPFGGRRWWFVCPRTGKRAAKLHLPDGAFTFASRQAYRLAYACQREPAHYRALRRAFKLRGKLGAEGGIGDYVEKPKWMRRRTYDRKLEEIFAAEEIVDAHMQNFARKLDRLLGR